MIDHNQYIAARPLVSGYPVVLAQKNAENDAAAAADFERILNQAAPPSSAPAADFAGEPEEAEFSFLSFIKAVIDIINPLQHIPVISTFYRHVTGDEIGPVARVAGDALYGGPVGAAVAVANVVYEQATGQDIGETVMAGVMGDGAAETRIAANDAATTVSTDDIIWSTPPLGVAVATAGIPLTPSPSFQAGTKETGPVPPTSPAFQARSHAPTFLPPTASGVDSTMALQSQEAPAVAARTAAQPELLAALPLERVEKEALGGALSPAVVSKDMIAVKMMEALDKYAEMKRPTPTVVSALY